MDKNTMVLFSKNIFKGMRICIRNQYSDHFNDWNILIIGKSYFSERMEYKIGIFGIVVVLMVFKRKRLKLLKSLYLWLTSKREEKPKKILQTAEEYYARQ